MFEKKKETILKKNLRTNRILQLNASYRSDSVPEKYEDNYIKANCYLQNMLNCVTRNRDLQPFLISSLSLRLESGRWEAEGIFLSPLNSNPGRSANVSLIIYKKRRLNIASNRIVQHHCYILHIKGSGHMEKQSV